MQLGADGNLHIYQTGTTTDVVPPYAGAVLTINPLPGGPTAAINALASSDVSTGGSAAASASASAIEPTTASASASAANAIVAPQQPPASANVQQATIFGSGGDLTTVPSAPISMDASASLSSPGSASTDVVAQPIRMLGSQPMGQIEFVAANSLYRPPFYQRLDFEASNSPAIEGQFLELISDQPAACLKDGSPIATQDQPAFRRGSAEKAPAVPISDVHSLALYSIIQDFHVNDWDGQIYFDLPFRTGSQKQVERFARAVDVLFAVDLP